MRNNKARELRNQGLSIIQSAGLQKMMLAFMILALMALPFMQPIQKKEEAKQQDSKSAGDMMVEIVWPGCQEYEVVDGLQSCKKKIDIDIDLWGRSPDDERPVGYSNRAGKTLNLLRDDLGASNDATDRNYEVMYARGLPDGEYVFNLHYFINRDGSLPDGVPVDVVISLKASGADKDTGGMRQVITRKAVLRTVNEEITVVRFVLHNGELDKDSVSDFFEELRTWQPTP